MRRTVGYLVIALTAPLWLASPAQASCGSERPEFLANANSYSQETDRGVEAVITMQQPSADSNCATGDMVAGGTSNMILNETVSGLAWAEIGWMYQKINGFKLFTEWGVNGVTTSCGGNTCVYSSACAALGQSSMFRVTKTGTGSVQSFGLQYSCNGGGVNTKDTTPDLNDSLGIATVEAVRFGSSSKNQQYSSTKVRDGTTDTWFLWSAQGGAHCQGVNSNDTLWKFTGSESTNSYATSSVNPTSSPGWCITT